MEIKRILIVGDSGRGKSSLAKKLSEKIGIKHHSTDDYFWKIKFTLPHEKEESIKNISTIYRQISWIVEGSTRHLINEGLEKSDQIIHLVHSNLAHQFWVLFRRKLNRKEENWGNLFSLYKHLIRRRFKLAEQKGKTTLEDMLQPYFRKIVKLKSFKEIDEFVNSK